MTENIVNVPLLRKAVEWAEVEAANPKGQWSQASWWETEADNGCGTTYCIAGWVCYQAGLDRHPDFTTMTADATFIDERAASLLGLPFPDAEPLFRGGNTIEDVRRIAEGIAGERL